MRPYYILENKIPIRCDDVIKWAEWMETDGRRVAFTEVPFVLVSAIKTVEILTAFLGIDLTFGFGVIQLFETMIFGGVYNNRQYRYTTYEEAEAGHVVACDLVRAAFGVIKELPMRKIIVLKQNK